MTKPKRIPVPSKAKYFSTPEDWFFEISDIVDKYTLRVLMAIVSFQAADKGRFGNKPDGRKHRSALTDAGFEVDMPYQAFKERKIDTRNIRRAFKRLTAIGVLDVRRSRCANATHRDPYVNCRVCWLSLFDYAYWNERNAITEEPVFKENSMKNIDVPDDGVYEKPHTIEEPAFFDDGGDTPDEEVLPTQAKLLLKVVTQAAPPKPGETGKNAAFFEERRLARLRREETERAQEAFRKAHPFNEARPLPPRLFDTPVALEA